jgi:hypothetical protein
MLVAFAPLMFGRLVMQRFVANANQSIAGELEIGDVALSWTGVQRLDGLRLRDPEGRTVAEFDLEVPSIRKLLSAAGNVNDGRAGKFGKWLGTVELALVTGPGVPSNLERALAPKESSRVVGPSKGDAERRGESGAGRDQRADDEPTIAVDSSIRFADLELELQVKHFSWSDPRLDADGRAIGVKDLIARLVFEAEQPAVLTVRGEHLYGDAHAPLAVDATIDVAGLIAPESRYESISGTAAVGALQTELFDRLLEADGQLQSALGPRFDVNVELGDPTAEGQRLTATLRSELQTLQLDARLADGLVRIAEDAPSRFDLRVPLAMLETAMNSGLPEGVALLAEQGNVPVSVAVNRFAIPISGKVGWQSAELALVVGVPQLGVQVDGHEPFDLRDGALTIGLSPDGPLQADFTVREARGGDLALGLRLPPNWQAHVADTDALRRIEYRAQLTVRDLPPERVISLLGSDERIADLLTKPIQVALRVQPAVEGAIHFELEADSGGNQVRAAADLLEDSIELTEGSNLLTLTVTTDALVALAGEAWPADFELASETGRVRAQVLVRDARWPLADGVGTATIEARLGALALSNAAMRDAQQRIAMDSFRLTSRLDGTQPVTLDADLALDDDAGSATVQVRSIETLTEIQGGAEPSWSVTLNSAGLETRLVDALAAQDGLLLDVFGPTLELDVEVEEWKAGSARVQARLDSSNAQLTWSGQLQDGILMSTGETESLDARVGITPLFQERIVGNLLPVLVGMEAVEGGEPALLEVTNFRMPLSAGDRSALAGLQADVRLTLGKVRAAVLPDLAKLLSSEVHQLRPTDLPVLDLKIRDGVVQLDKLPIEIEKTPVVFTGNYALVGRQMEFRCSVPLFGLRGEVGSVLNEARDYLDPNLAVPLRVRGNPSKPQIGIDGDFLKQVVRDSSTKAAGDALEKGLRKLFGND